MTTTAILLGLGTALLTGGILIIITYLTKPRPRTGPPPPPQIPPEYYKSQEQSAKELSGTLRDIFTESFNLIKAAHKDAAQTIRNLKQDLYPEPPTTPQNPIDHLYQTTKTQLENHYGTPLPPTAQNILKRIKALKNN